MNISMAENAYGVCIPLGVFIVTPILLSLAGEIIHNSQAEDQPIMPFQDEFSEK